MLSLGSRWCKEPCAVRNPGASPLLPPVLVRLVLPASAGVSSGLFRESNASDSMCEGGGGGGGDCGTCCCSCSWAESTVTVIPFCRSAPPAIISHRSPEERWWFKRSRLPSRVWLFCLFVLNNPTDLVPPPPQGLHRKEKKNYKFIVVQLS